MRSSIQRKMANHCRILLKRKDADLFYKAPDNWVEARSEAAEFANSSQAHRFCHENNFQDVVILMDFGNPDLDVQLAVR